MYIYFTKHLIYNIITFMNANIKQISELERILSVKNATNWSFLSLFGKFALGGVLSRHSLDKKRGVDIVQLTLSHPFPHQSDDGRKYI